MIPCKTLIRTSVSCLHFGASAIPKQYLSSNFISSGLRLKNFKINEQCSISRSFGSANCAVSVETSDGISLPAVAVEPPEDYCEDKAEGLLTINKDDVSALMKMERQHHSEIESNRPRRWFPYLDKWKSGDDSHLNSSEVVEAIDPYLMESRKERFNNVVNNRTYSVSLVVEGLSDFGNVSAAFRSADALGIQSVHIVSCDSRRYRYNRHVSMGAEKWLDIELWDSVKECFGALKARGYRIATTHLGMDTVSVYDVDWSIPTAIVVGNELRGISAEALELSDLYCSIPMKGMVDSFNVSVAAGLLMHHAVCDRTLRMGYNGDLTQDERKILLAEFYLRHNKNAISIAQEFSKRKIAKL